MEKENSVNRSCKQLYTLFVASNNRQFKNKGFFFLLFAITNASWLKKNNIIIIFFCREKQRIDNHIFLKLYFANPRYNLYDLPNY